MRKDVLEKLEVAVVCIKNIVDDVADVFIRENADRPVEKMNEKGASLSFSFRALESGKVMSLETVRVAHVCLLVNSPRRSLDRMREEELLEAFEGA